MDAQHDDTVTFADLQIHPSVLQALSDVGYESPSAIQAATIPALIAGSDVVGLAQTGTGKTAAFAMPILSKIDVKSTATQALVLAPTRELALQVAEAFSRYGAHLPQIHVLPIYGGSSYTVQLAGLRRGAQVVVGTPGRVIDHLERGTLDLSHIDYLVLDEADEMLTMGFAEDVERILSETPEYKQVALFSATMPPAIRKLTKKYLHDPVEVKVESKTATAENISQRFIQVAGPRKMDALTRVLEVESFEAMIVFVRTKQATEEVAEKLRARGFSAAAINGDIPQAQRERTIAALKEGGSKGIDILVATDVAARGLVVDYERQHDVPMADIAAALALQSRNGEEFLMTEPPPERRPKERPDRPAKAFRGAGEGPRKGLATYRIAVGKRHKVGPGSIVGAIANEGGLHRSDFGHITIKPDFSLVELPAKLSRETLKALEKTRIYGVMINLQPDRSPDKNRRSDRGAPRREHRG